MRGCLPRAVAAASSQNTSMGLALSHPRQLMCLLVLLLLLPLLQSDVISSRRVPQLLGLLFGHCLLQHLVTLLPEGRRLWGLEGEWYQARGRGRQGSVLIQASTTCAA
jgi:hypothetical protein